MDQALERIFSLPSEGALHRFLNRVTVSAPWCYLRLVFLCCFEGRRS